MVPLGTIFAVSTVMLGCGCNVVFLEHLIRASSSSGNMIVFFQFLFISIEGFINHSNFGRTKRIVPLRNYVIMVMMYFTINVTNIMAFNCHIPMPLHMIIKSGSLVANMVIGAILLKRTYGLNKVLAVMLVTAGIFMCTIATSVHKMASANDSEETSPLLLMLVGILLMTFALLMTARLGVYQEVLYTEYGKQSQEALFYNHAIPLPFFVVLAPSILENIALLNQSELSPVPLLTDAYALMSGDRTLAVSVTSLPILWQYMLANVVTQYVCIRSIFYLTTVCTSLTVTLIVTLRKFVSLIISVVYFSNDFTSLHWCGTILVFIGTMLYTDIIPVARNFEAKKASFATDNHKNGMTTYPTTNKIKSS